MRSNAKCYDELRAELDRIPLIDCHDHSDIAGPRPTDPINAVLDWYVRSDLHSASSDDEIEFILDEKRSLEDRWPVLERAWKRTCLTGYAQVVRRAVRRVYGEQELSLAALLRIRDHLIDFSDPATYQSVLEEARILIRLEDIGNIPGLLNGSYTPPPRSRPVISLPSFHAVCSYEQVRANTAPLRRNITSLDEYIAACRDIFTRLKTVGAVAFKDQSAYDRPLDYGNPTRAQAEAAFNWFMEDPRRRLSYPEGNRPLGDFLFHEFMRMARDLDLPVQIHTGHMAGIRNSLGKTNAALLTPLIELHRDTRFDLFHANWPYDGDLLFLAKNYPNVAIDFCWANMVDPLYSQDLFRRIISSVPHGKVHGYGSDLNGEWLIQSWAHADLARDNIAIALADLVEMEYLHLDEARQAATDWLFNNPNQFFKLNL